MSNARNDKNFKRKRGQHPSFQKGVSYWDSIDATVDGVLGGYGNGSLPRVDALGSRMFLLSLKPSLSTIVASHRQSLPERLRQYNALDCGAGIGRVTDSVLLHLFDRVDLVESSSHFLDAAIQASSGWRGISDASKGVRFFKAGLQTFNPVSPPMQYSAAKGAQDFEAGYDVVWIQWVAGHLGSQELVDFLKQCAKALKHPAVPCEKSLIVLKENVLLGKRDVFDDTDSSVVRCFFNPSPLHSKSLCNWKK